MLNNCATASISLATRNKWASLETEQGLYQALLALKLLFCFSSFLEQFCSSPLSLLEGLRSHQYIISHTHPCPRLSPKNLAGLGHVPPESSNSQHTCALHMENNAQQVHHLIQQKPVTSGHVFHKKYMVLKVSF